MVSVPSSSQADAVGAFFRSRNTTDRPHRAAHSDPSGTSAACVGWVVQTQRPCALRAAPTHRPGTMPSVPAQTDQAERSVPARIPHLSPRPSPSCCEGLGRGNEPHMDRDHQRESLSMALDQVNRRDLVVCVARRLGFSVEQIARAQNRPVDEIESTFAEVMALLRNALHQG